MASSFTDSRKYLFTSESVTEGHPDKICDQISDAVLDALLARNPAARVACEVCATTGLVVVMGEISADGAHVDIPKLVRYYQTGRLELDGLISRQYRLEEINEAIAGVKRNEALRNVIVFDGPESDTFI